MIAATMPPPPPQSVGREGTKRAAKAGRKRQRTQASADASDSGDESEEDPLASLAKKLQNKKPRKGRVSGNKNQEGKSTTTSQADDGEISEEELTETEEEIEDSLIDTMEKIIGAWGDEAVDGYVVWARPDGFPWWPAQMITLVGLDPGTMKQLVARWKPDYAETHCLCMFLGEKPDFAWVHRSKVKHFERGNPRHLANCFSPVLPRFFPPFCRAFRLPGAKDGEFFFAGGKWATFEKQRRKFFLVLDTARDECMPGKKDKKQRSVLKALEIADRIHTDPRDMSSKQAAEMLGELDRVLQQQRLFIRETTQRIERTLDPGLAEREAAKQASLPIWAR